jgi:hypothetical protein
MTIVEQGVLKDDRVPILFLDVNLGGEDTSRIVIYEGDDPMYVAKKFSKENSK